MRSFDKGEVGANTGNFGDSRGSEESGRMDDRYGGEWWPG